MNTGMETVLFVVGYLVPVLLMVHTLLSYLWR